MIDKERIFKKMNDVLMSGSAKNGKLKPLFGQVDEIAIDKNGRPFKSLKDLEAGRYQKQQIYLIL